MAIESKYRPRFTYEDYCQWEGRWELIHGMPYSLHFNYGEEHQEALGCLLIIFRDAIKYLLRSIQRI